jgi:hypothetical protein
MHDLGFKIRGNRLIDEFHTIMRSPGIFAVGASGPQVLRNSTAPQLLGLMLNSIFYLISRVWPPFCGELFFAFFPCAGSKFKVHEDTNYFELQLKPRSQL